MHTQASVPRNRIRALRERAGLRRAQVAAALAVDQSTVQRWETHITATIPDAKKAQLADLLRTDVPCLMGYGPDPDTKEAA